MHYRPSPAQYVQNECDLGHLTDSMLFSGFSVTCLVASVTRGGQISVRP